MERRKGPQALIAAIAAFVLSACNSGTPHSARDYVGAVALIDPAGSLTTIVGPKIPIVKMTSTLKFPEGDTESGVRSILFYDGAADQTGMCLFEVWHRARYPSIVKEGAVKQPCDGKQWAHFRVAGNEVAFVAHLVHTRYKSTPVTLLEISDHRAPPSLMLVY